MRTLILAVISLVAVEAQALFTLERLGLPAAACVASGYNLATEDPLTAQLRTNLAGFRDRLLKAARDNDYDLRKVLIPEATPHLQWMLMHVTEGLRIVNKVPKRTQSEWVNYEGRIRLLEAVRDELRLILDSGKPVSYGAYLLVALRFTDCMNSKKNYDLFDLPTSTASPSLVKWAVHDGYNFEDLARGRARSILRGQFKSFDDHFKAKARRGNELASYVILPIAQTSIDEVIEGDLFLEMIGKRVYPGGIITEPRPAHISDTMPSRNFLGHDLSHAASMFEAYERMIYVYEHSSLDPAIKEWYRKTVPKTDEYVDALIAGHKSIQSVSLQKSVRAVSWRLFHENAVSFNPLDIHHMAQLNLTTTVLTFENDYVPSEKELKKIYGFRVDRRAALQWHIDFWKKFLPRNEAELSALIGAHRQFLSQQRRLRENWSHFD